MTQMWKQTDFIDVSEDFETNIAAAASHRIDKQIKLSENSKLNSQHNGDKADQSTFDQGFVFEKSRTAAIPSA
jgi:hypothetical protein